MCLSVKEAQKNIDRNIRYLSAYGDVKVILRTVGMLRDVAQRLYLSDPFSDDNPALRGDASGSRSWNIGTYVPRLLTAARAPMSAELTLFDARPGRPAAPATKHSARFPPTILEAISAVVPKGSRNLDPFAGTGRIHYLDAETVGVELEREWAKLHPGTIIGSALDLLLPDRYFDVVVTSPTYGNRFADNQPALATARLVARIRTIFGRKLHEDNSGAMHWGPRYRLFHQIAWREARRVLKPGGLSIVNTSNHIRGGVEQLVSEVMLER